MTTEYVPGTCNIGAGEIRQRRAVALIGFILFISSTIALFAIDAPRTSRLGLFFPLVVTSIGWVQSRKKFCLAYGFMGTFNFGKIGQLSRVQDKDAKRADRITALSILFQAVLYATLATVAIYLLPTSL
ncbi:unannotated protein [freshwater metagenome]|uniref:Unannotated protein n=1 Tax=freshwater metagenome TaxID=449393 RepID=A0A6J6JP96_9ZZZZ|nr:hypothetical protein [Actinomycetota bacterium]